MFCFIVTFGRPGHTLTLPAVILIMIRQWTLMRQEYCLIKWTLFQLPLSTVLYLMHIIQWINLTAAVHDDDLFHSLFEPIFRNIIC